MTAWLIDKSALTRIGASVEAQEWVTRINRGLVAISTVTLLEVGYSARSSIELSAALGNPPISDMPVEYLAPAIEDRAIEVQRLLAQRGHHRAPSVADLLIAATAEGTGRTVLHVDKDFELIAGITGQPCERLLLP